MMSIKPVILGLAMFAGAGLRAQQPVAVPAPPMLCDAPLDFAAWVRPVSLVAAPTIDRDTIPRMTMGQAAAVTLSPQDAMRPAVPLHPRLAGYGGLLRLAVPVAGTYRFALSGPAWLDVVEGGRSVPSAAHGHGERCGPIRKLVDLPLSAGDHLVQLGEAPSSAMSIMAVRVLR